jgi:hypothetical protein
VGACSCRRFQAFDSAGIHWPSRMVEYRPGRHVAKCNLALLQRATPDQEPIRNPDQAKHEHEREHFQLRLSLLIRRFPKKTASATIAVARFLIHDRPTFAALLAHQSDYASSPWSEPSPKLKESSSTDVLLTLAQRAGAPRITRDFRPATRLNTYASSSRAFEKRSSRIPITLNASRPNPGSATGSTGFRRPNGSLAP